MARTSRNIETGVATINPPLTSISTALFPTLQHEGRKDHQAENNLGFGEFAAAIREELAPEGMLETLLIDRVILASWHLHSANQAETTAMTDAIEKAAHCQDKSSSPPARNPALAELQSGAFGAQLSLEKALDMLRTFRNRRQPRWGRTLSNAPEPLVEPSDEAGLNDFDICNEWPIVPHDDPSDLIADDLTENWQDCLVFDFNVSETSPVVKGTWVTVSHVVSLIVDGWTWGDILRTHPELTEDDIRVCLAYTVAQDNGEA